jgi:hypothetical protein
MLANSSMCVPAAAPSCGQSRVIAACFVPTVRCPVRQCKRGIFDGPSTTVGVPVENRTLSKGMWVWDGSSDCECARPPIAKKLCCSVKYGFRRTGRTRHAEDLFRSAASDCHVHWGGPSEACDSGLRRGPADSMDMQLRFGSRSGALPAGAMVQAQPCDGRRCPLRLVS